MSCRRRGKKRKSAVELEEMIICHSGNQESVATEDMSPSTPLSGSGRVVDKQLSEPGIGEPPIGQLFRT